MSVLRFALVACLVLAGCRTPAPPLPPGTDGMAPVPGGNVWYRVAGHGSGVPLILVHGGPGGTSDYLTQLEQLGDERRVVRYDQLGSGRSDQPDDASLWKLERFVKELAALRKHLGITRYVLLGHSWGGAVAAETALTKPEGLAGLVLASPLLSTPRWVSDAGRLRATLPADVQATLTKAEREGTTDSPDYQAAMMAFYERYLIRQSPWPPEVKASFEHLNQSIYVGMWGPSEFFASGTLLLYDRSRQLGTIRVPTLLTAGRYDEATPETVAWFRDQMPCAELTVFEDSAHLAMVEETEAYVDALRLFLHRIDAGYQCPEAVPTPPTRKPVRKGKK